MILTLALAVTSPVQTVQDSNVAEEFIVLGKRLGEWRGSTRLRGGKQVCRTRRSSGDPQVDAVACAAVEVCLTQAQPKIDALIASKSSKAQRETLLEPINQEVGICVKHANDAGLERLAVQRTAATD